MNAENETETWLLSARTYFVPRSTQLVRVAVRDTETARDLRTELELLRRVQRCAALRGVVPAEKNEPDWDPNQRLSDVRWELNEIIEDASRVIVTEMIEAFDQEFPSLRKEISMAVVNEEAENIVAEAVESGAAEPENTNRQNADADSPPTDSANPVQPADASPGEEDQDPKEATEIGESVPEAVQASVGSVDPIAHDVDPIAALDEAIAEAQSVIGETSTAKPETSSGETEKIEMDSQPEAMESDQTEVTACFESPDTPLDVGIDEDMGSAAVEEVNEANEHPVEQSDPQPVDQQPEPIAAIAPDPHVSTPVDSKPDAPFTSNEKPLDCSEQAVNNLEEGIRTLAGQLCLQIDAVSTKTTTSFQELAAARTRIAELLSRAENLADDVIRLRGEAKNARDGTVAAFREARQLRDDTRRSQERAYASAVAAERAADQARREVKTAAAVALETA